MSKQLYEEALADVKQLRQLAEDNAKREIIEAVTPKIRQLIESQLLGEAVQEEVETSQEEPSQADVQADIQDDDLVEVSAEALQQLEKLVESRKQKLELSIYKLHEAVSNATISEMSKQDVSALSSRIESLYADVCEHIDEESREPLTNKLEECFAVVHGLMENNMKNFARKTLTEGDMTFTIEGLPDDIDLSTLSVKIVKETEDEEGAEAAPEASAEEAAPEGEGEGTQPETGEGEAAAGTEEEMSAKPTKEGFKMSHDPIVEIDEKELVAEIRRMRALSEAKEKHCDVCEMSMSKCECGANEGYDLDEYTEANEDDQLFELVGEPTADGNDLAEADEASGEDLDELAELDEDALLELALETVADSDDMDEADDVAEYQGRHGRPGEQLNHQARQSGATLESIRRQVVAEVRLQLEAKKAKKAKKMGGHGPGKNMLGTKDGAVKNADWYKAKSKKPVHVKAGSTLEKMKMKGGKSMLPKSVSMKESLSNSDVGGAELDSLRAQLAETNLFNAKLLYTNKLLQNESISSRQKAQIIEQLDEAASLREVKLVYESLQKTLSKSSPLSESTNRVIGSSSRPTTTGGTTLAESVEASRWARLAGIK